MKWTPTIIVLILAAISVGSLVMVSRSDSAGSGGDDAAAGPLFTAQDLPVARINRITLRRGDDAALVFERNKDAWTQVEPFAFVMDPFSISRLAVDASELVAVDGVDTSGPNALTAEALSLDPPEAELTFEWPEGSLALELGRRGIAGRAYLRIKGEDRIHVVGQALHDRAIEMDAREWRDRRIFHNAGVESDRIVRKEGELPVVLERDQRRWVMREPVVTRTDPVATNELFHAVGNAVMGGFILDQPDTRAMERFGLIPPAATFEITTERPVLDGEEVTRIGETQRLLVGSAIGAGSLERFGMIEGQPVVFRLTVPVLQALFARPKHLADPTACGVQPADVMSMRIRGQSGEFDLRRDLDRWLAPNAGPAGEDLELHGPQVDELLDQLTSLRAPLVEIMDYPSDLEVATITLYGSGMRPLDTVRIARELDTGRWALENGDNVLRIFPESLSMRLTPEDFGLPGGD